MLYLLSALSVMYILLMYYISLLLLPPNGFVLCYIGLLVLTLWRFDDDVISPSPGKVRHSLVSELPGSHTAAWGWTCGLLRMQHKYPCHRSLQGNTLNMWLIEYA